MSEEADNFSKHRTLARVEPSQIEAAVGGSLLEYLSPAMLDEVLSQADWSLKQEVEMLTGIANDAENAPRDRIAAGKGLRTLIIDTLRISGQLATLVTRQQAIAPATDDEPARFRTIEMRRVVGALHNTEQLLAANRAGLGATEALAVPVLTQGESDASPEVEEAPVQEAPQDAPEAGSPDAGGTGGGEPGRDGSGDCQRGPAGPGASAGADRGDPGGGDSGADRPGSAPDPGSRVRAGGGESEQPAAGRPEGEAGHDGLEAIPVRDSAGEPEQPRTHRAPRDPYPGLATGTK